MHDPPWHDGAMHEAHDPPNAMLLWDASCVDGKVEAGTSETGGRHETGSWWKSSRWNNRLTSIRINEMMERAKPYAAVFANEYVTLTMGSTRERRFVFHAPG